MNKKAEIGVGGILLVGIAVIVCLVLFQASAQQVGKSVNTITVANTSLGSSVVNGTAQYLTAYQAISNVKVWNATGDVEIPTDQYTATDNVVYNGVVAWRIVPAATMPDYKSVWKVQGTAQPVGYVAESGGRAVTNLIVILAALGVAMIAYLAIRKIE